MLELRDRINNENSSRLQEVGWPQLFFQLKYVYQGKHQALSNANKNW